MRRPSSVACTTSIVLTLVTAPGGGTPADTGTSWFESLVMPGDVAAKHVRVERQCDKCHTPFDKTAQDGLCLACHTDVAADREARRGYHGRAPAVQSRLCKSCHSEHHGRAAALVHLDRKGFDHRLTDFPLQGAHGWVECDACHLGGLRYREATTQCIGCHGGSDPHVGGLGRACGGCHVETAWTAVHFNHGATAFPLRGHHRDARCDQCHFSKRFKPTPKRCAACHAHDDKHRGSLGEACQSCHTARAWAATQFDHLQRTRFPLQGPHARAACKSCHEQKDARGRTPTTCAGCHRRDDVHQGHLGRDCASCHTPSAWRQHTFDHGRRTRFPLRGRHREARCTDCHIGDRAASRLDTSCYACHRQDDVHHGRQGTRCDTCHDERGWQSAVLFEHGSTRFPLLGAHARIACTQCHISPVFAQVGRECVSCHEDADVHRGRKGSRCDDCHSALTWTLPPAAGSGAHPLDRSAHEDTP